MAFKGFQMVPEVSMHKILYVSKTLYMLQKASSGFQSVEWTLSMTLQTKLTSYYAQQSANNWSCWDNFCLVSMFSNCLSTYVGAG